MDDGHDPAEDHWWYDDDDDYPGEAATIAAADVEDNFIDMFGNFTDDLYKLVWEGSSSGQPVASTVSQPELPGASLKLPPSDDMMAAWLYPIVSGEVDHACDSTNVPAEVKSEPGPMAMAVSLGTMSTKRKGKLPAKEDMPGTKNENTGTQSNEGMKAASGGSSKTRSSHHSGTHNSTERRRRCKINEKLRTLQQLVPGCDKSNQASTLEQTIQYMKSLQQQVQSMNVRPADSSAAAVYSVVQPPMPMQAAAAGQVRPGAVVPMVPYGAMIPYPHYHAVMMPAAASSMMPTPATSAAPERQRTISRDQQRHKKEKGKRRL
nr:putative transcription factor bHLH056 [Lolium perenne]